MRFDGPLDTVVHAETGAQLLTVLREALSNVARHAEAASVDVVVRVEADLVLSVADDGVGIGGGPTARQGLRNLESRAKDMGGNLTLVPRHPRGTVLEWTVPLDGDEGP